MATQHRCERVLCELEQIEEYQDSDTEMCNGHTEVTQMLLGSAYRSHWAIGSGAMPHLRNRIWGRHLHTHAETRFRRCSSGSERRKMMMAETKTHSDWLPPRVCFGECIIMNKNPFLSSPSGWHGCQSSCTEPRRNQPPIPKMCASMTPMMTDNDFFFSSTPGD